MDQHCNQVESTRSRFARVNLRSHVSIMTSCNDNVLDNVSISSQYILKRVIVDGVEAPRKVTKYLCGFKWLVQQKP